MPTSNIPKREIGRDDGLRRCVANGSLEVPVPAARSKIS